LKTSKSTSMVGTLRPLSSHYSIALTERELLHALLTGKVPANRQPHLRTLLEEAPRALLKGLIQQVRNESRPGKVERNLDRLAVALGLPEDWGKWLRTSD